MSLRGILVGSLTLIALHTLVAYQGPSQRLSDLGRLAAGFVDAFLSPERPAIADRDAAGAAKAPAYTPDNGFSGAGGVFNRSIPAPAPR